MGWAVQRQPGSENQSTADEEKSDLLSGQHPSRGITSEPSDRSSALSLLAGIVSAVVSKVSDQRLLFVIGISTILSMVVAILAVHGSVGDVQAIVVLSLIAGLAVLVLLLPSGSTTQRRRTRRAVGLLHQCALFVVGAIFALSAATISLAVFHWPSTFIESAVSPSVSATATAVTASIQPTVEAAVVATNSAVKDIVISSEESDVIRQDGYYLLRPGQRVKVFLTPKKERRLQWQIVLPRNPEFYFKPVEFIGTETELIIPETMRNTVGTGKVEAVVKVSEYNEVRNSWSPEAVFANIVIQ